MRTLLQLLPGRDHRGPWLYWTRSKKTQKLWNISFQISWESYRIATSVTGPILFRFLILFLHTTSDSQTSFCALFDCGNRIANAKFICTGEQRCVEGRVKINIDSNERTREAKPTGRKTAVPPTTFGLRISDHQRAGRSFRPRGIASEMWQRRWSDLMTQRTNRNCAEQTRIVYFRLSCFCLCLRRKSITTGRTH